MEGTTLCAACLDRHWVILQNLQDQFLCLRSLADRSLVDLLATDLDIPALHPIGNNQALARRTEVGNVGTLLTTLAAMPPNPGRNRFVVVVRSGFLRLYRHARRLYTSIAVGNGEG